VKSLPRNEVVYVRATADGTVLVARDNVGNAGNLVNITHEKHGTTSRYAHNDKIIVREGQAVKQGDIISTMGNTGDSDGKHLHFELRQGLGGTKSTTTPIPIRESDFNKKFNYMD